MKVPGEGCAGCFTNIDVNIVEKDFKCLTAHRIEVKEFYVLLCISLTSICCGMQCYKDCLIQFTPFTATCVAKM